MTADPLVLITEVDKATARLLETAGRLDDAAVAAPSLLPGWSRGHVLAHVARNADSYTNLLTWARTGVETPQYASVAQREADIEAGAARARSEQVADLAGAAQRFSAAVAWMSPESWRNVVRQFSGAEVPAAALTWGRLREVEVHHVDLNAGYSPDDWSDGFVHRLLHEEATGFSARGGVLPMRLHATDLGHELLIGTDPAITVRGPGAAIAAWLAGRSTGDDLTVLPDGALPTVPAWK